MPRFRALGTKLYQEPKVCCLWRSILIKIAPKRKAGNLSVQTVGDLMLLLTEGCPVYKEHEFRQHVVQQQISYSSALKRASPPHQGNTYTFTPEQIVSLVTNVVLNIAQPQICNKGLPVELVQAKSDLSKQTAETAAKCLGVNIEGKEVFKSIISRPTPSPPALFTFSSTQLVEKKKAPLKASTVLKAANSTTSSTTTSSKTPSSGSEGKFSSKLLPKQGKSTTKPATKQDKTICQTITTTKQTSNMDKLVQQPPP